MAVPQTPQHDQAPSSAMRGAETDSFDLRAYWRTALRRRWVIVSVFVASVVVTLFVTLRQTRIYDATCSIIIDPSAPKVLDSEQMKDVVETGTGGYWASKEYFETQYKVITSRAVAQRVAEKLQLGSNLKFLGLDRVQDPAERERLRRAADPVQALQGHLFVEPVRDSRVVRLRYEDPDPALAALVANAWAECYIADNLAVKSSTTQNASEWLEQQLGDLEIKLERSGKELFDFKRTHDIVATSWEDRQSMVSQRLTAINEALTRTRVQRAQLEARNQAIQALGDAIDRGDERAEALVPMTAIGPIQQLKVRYIEAKAECEDMKLKYLEHHPRLESCEKKVALARASLQQQIKTVIAAAVGEYQEIVNTERNLFALLNDAKTDAFGLNQYERDYVELKRTHDNNQRLYELVLKRLKDTGVTGMLQVSNVRILERARPAGVPIRPNVAKRLLTAVILGLLGGLALAFGADHLDTTITSQEQVEEKLGLTFLGILPSIPKENAAGVRDLVVAMQPHSAVAECVRAVRTNLLFMSPDKPLRTILVTSSGPQEGKTTTAAALAETMALGGNRVLVIDADMRRPRVHTIFGLSASQGLSSVVVGEGTLESAVRTTEVPNLFVLPCGPVPPNPAELLHTETFGRILEEATRRFDRVIVDSPPVGVVADAAVISTRVDGTLVVLKAGQTSRDAARRAVRNLLDVNARLLGAVLNDLDLGDRRYGQYYEYYRYGYYGGERESPGPAGAA